MTEWVTIEQFPNYEVSRDGRVRGKIRGRELKQSFDNYGYLLVFPYKDGKRYTRRVHRLVAETFIPNTDNKPDVNHIDGDKSNNDFSNLEWATESENAQHAFDTGLHNGLQGSTNPSSKLTESDVRNIKISLMNGEKQTHIAKRYGVVKSTINAISTGRKWSHVNIKE